MERDAQLPIVRDFMIRHPHVLHAEDSLSGALDQMQRWRLAEAPVVDEVGALVGVLSELDCLRALSTAAFDGMPVGTVGTHMTSDELVTADPDDDVFQLAGPFGKTRHRALPVVENGALVGVVTLKVINQALYRMHLERKRVHRSRTPAGAAWDREATEERERRRR